MGILAAGAVAYGQAQDSVNAPPASGSPPPHADWLNTSASTATSSTETFRTTRSQDIGDPFTVLANGALWQDEYNTLYTRQLDPAVTLSCQATTLTLDGADVSRAQAVELLLQPADLLTLRGGFHGSTTNAPIAADSTTSSGLSFFAESHLPSRTVLTLSLNADRSSGDVPSGIVTQTTSYDAQFQQPIGSLPLTAVVKGGLVATTMTNAPASSLPSLEQSLVWKPLQDTTLQAGLRQQQYQEYPGVDHELNEALFADWSQQVVDNVSWHSYAEVLNSRGLTSQAPAAPISSGANGTAQATAPGANAAVTSSLPVSLDNQTLTFSTGPSFQLQKDISASVEYSNRWDTNPGAGNAAQEQRVSVSLKGSF